MSVTVCRGIVAIIDSLLFPLPLTRLVVVVVVVALISIVALLIAVDLIAVDFHLFVDLALVIIVGAVIIRLRSRISWLSIIVVTVISSLRIRNTWLSITASLLDLTWFHDSAVENTAIKDLEFNDTDQRLTGALQLGMGLLHALGSRLNSNANKQEPEGGEG